MPLLTDEKLASYPGSFCRPCLKVTELEFTWVFLAPELGLHHRPTACAFWHAHHPHYEQTSTTLPTTAATGAFLRSGCRWGQTNDPEVPVRRGVSIPPNPLYRRTIKDPAPTINQGRKCGNRNAQLGLHTRKCSLDTTQRAARWPNQIEDYISHKSLWLAVSLQRFFFIIRLLQGVLYVPFCPGSLRDPRRYGLIWTLLPNTTSHGLASHSEGENNSCQRRWEQFAKFECGVVIRNWA